MKKKLLRVILRRFLSSLALILGSLMLMFVNTQVAFSALSNSSASNDQIVIEHLRLHVSEVDKNAWLNAEKDSWEKWLTDKRGFLGRQLFWDPQREEAVLLISWASRADWKGIPQKEISAVQEHFEELARSGTGKGSGNPFPILFEGELLPQ